MNRKSSHWGGARSKLSPYTLKTASDLNNAIARVLNEKYAEDPDGQIPHLKIIIYR